MVKVRLHGEPAEIEKLIELICNGLPAVRVLSIIKTAGRAFISVYISTLQ